MGFGLPAMIAGSTILDWIGRDEANKAARSASREQMSFQERMSNTAHQREVEDLRLAGLNPILSAGGGGASTPVGSSYVPHSVFEGSANTALALARLREDVKAIRASTAVSREVAKTNVADRELKNVQKAEAFERARLHRAEASIAEADEFSARNRMRVESLHPEAMGWMDALGRRLGMIGNAAFSLTGTGASLKYLLGGQGGRRRGGVSDREFYRRDEWGNLRRPR